MLEKENRIFLWLLCFLIIIFGIAILIRIFYEPPATYFIGWA